MRKRLTLLISLLSFGLTAQEVAFRDCENPECSQEKLKSLFQETQAAIFQYQGISFNDSISFEFQYKDGGLELVSSYAWLDESSIKYYFAVLQGSLDQLILDTGITYQVHWNQELDESWQKHEELNIKHNFPKARECKGFNRKGQLACTRYFGVFELYSALDSLNINEDFKAEIYFSNGIPKAIDVSRAPLKNKEIIKAIRLYTASYRSHFIGEALDRSRPFKITFERFHLRDFDNTNPYFERQLGFYIDNQLWNQLKRAIDPYHLIPTLDTSGQLYETEYQKAMYLYLEEQLAQGRIPNRKWTFDKSTLAAIASLENPNTDDVSSFQRVESVPIYEGCEEDKDNEALKYCFQVKIMQHVSKEFKFPNEARKGGIQGKMYVNFIVEKNGSIQEIEIVKSSHPLLDLESIRVVSLIPDLKAASIDGKPVRMSFTLPINAKLQ